MEADQDGDGKLSFEEFAQTVSNTVCSTPPFPLEATHLPVSLSISHHLPPFLGHRETNDP